MPDISVLCISANNFYTFQNIDNVIDSPPFHTCEINIGKKLKDHSAPALGFSFFIRKLHYLLINFSS